jgi:uncharacterized protein (TIRG00374 family)
VTDSAGGWSNRPAAVFLFRALRFVVAGALLWWAARDVDWPVVGSALAGASWRWLVVAVLLTALDRVVMAWRWLSLLRAIEANRPLRSWALLRVFFVSTFIGTFLPGSIGGDAVRTLAATRHGVTMANAAASVAVDRVLGTLSVLLMAVVGIWLAGAQLDEPRLLPIAVAASVAGVGLTAVLLFRPGAYERALRLIGTHRLPTVDRLARKFLAASGQYGRHGHVLGRVLTASIGVQLLRTLQTWCLGLALGIPLSGAWYFATVPIIVLIVLLPISFAGLGTGNLAFVTLFTMAGVPDTQAFVLSVLFIALSVLGNVPGGVLVALGSDVSGPGRSVAPGQRDV